MNGIGLLLSSTPGGLHLCRCVSMLRNHCPLWCAGKLSEQAKDQIEEHVGLLVRTITQSLDALKNGVMAAQQPQEDGQPLINEQMAAHLHGAVGRLAALTGSFEGLQL